MLNKIIAFAILILIVQTAQAEEFVIGEGGLTSDDPFIQQSQQTATAHNEVMDKLSEIETKIQTMLETATSLMITQQIETQTVLIVIMIISNIATVGMAGAIYLYFKSIGRV